MVSTDFERLRTHLYATHKNLAAMGLPWDEAQDQHWHEHNGPGGLRNHTHDPELEPAPPATRQKVSCPRDTNGDGDCGRPACPHCGKYGRWSQETQTAVAVYLSTWHDEMRGFDSTPESGAAGLLTMLADVGVLKLAPQKIDLSEFDCETCGGPCRDES